VRPKAAGRSARSNCCSPCACSPRAASSRGDGPARADGEFAVADRGGRRRPARLPRARGRADRL